MASNGKGTVVSNNVCQGDLEKSYVETNLKIGPCTHILASVDTHRRDVLLVLCSTVNIQQCSNTLSTSLASLLG